MTLTLEEIKERLKRWDELTLVEELALRSEDIVERYCIENSKTFTSFRFYNVIGSDGISPTNMDGLMYNLMKARETGVFNLYGGDYNTPDGTPVRDYVHVLSLIHI